MKTLKIIQNIVLGLCYLSLMILFILLIGGNKSVMVMGTFIIIGVSLLIVNEGLIITKEFAFKKEKQKGNTSK